MDEFGRILTGVLKDMLTMVEQNGNDIAFLKLWMTEIRGAVRAMIGWNFLLTIGLLVLYVRWGWQTWREHGRPN